MLNLIVDITKQTNCRIDKGTLFCDEYIVIDSALISFFEDKNILENSIGDVAIGSKVSLELTLAKLTSTGFYVDCNTFLSRNRYQIPSELFYINELEIYSNIECDFVLKHRSVVKFIKSVEGISKYKSDDVDICNVVLFKESKAAFLPFIYSKEDLDLIKISSIKKLNSLTAIFEEEETEKKLIFINEFIELMNTFDEEKRFKYFLGEFEKFYDRGINAFQFYLSNFSSNKLKLEIDSKALEYTQKIQGVINDAQTKLIAIPTAFVLVFTVLDFTDPVSLKNIGTIISVFIFAILIQLFLNNQRSALNFIEQNIKSYEDIFDKTKIEKISEKFKLVGEELGKQKRRLLITKVILWSFPILLVCGWLYLAYSNLLMSIGFLVLSSALCILPYFIKPKFN